MSEDVIREIGARSLGELLRRVPGFRVEDFGDGANANYTIRGLPLAGFGSKWLQFQEDGLPVLEFGDISYLTNDMLVRPDLNIARIESIRGGSASTFASNSPGGIINFLSKTGEEEGGQIALTSGIDYKYRRFDVEYGGRLSKSLRFHLGGYYNSGAGPRDPGYNAIRGGQIKLNVTREFENGYVRVYAKVLDERLPYYSVSPLRVSGTNDNPSYTPFLGFDPRSDGVMSNATRAFAAVDVNGNVYRADMGDGVHTKSQTIGLETRFDVGDWTIVDRARYSNNSADFLSAQPSYIAAAGTVAARFGGPGATLSYATGPMAGQAITDPTSIAGNGLAGMTAIVDFRTPNANYFVNDLRASRVWKMGAGDLTLTGGVYKSLQTFNQQFTLATAIQTFAGSNTALLDITNAAGRKITQNGVVAFSLYPSTAASSRYTNVDYDVTAPYASLNYHQGRLAIGGSLRYDSGSAKGLRYSAELGGGRPRWRPVDINADGVISPAEQNTGIIPSDQPGPVAYNYNYLSYSAGVNFRVNKSFAVFARYSRGARALADRILFSPAISATTGTPIAGASTYNPVRQGEAGVKYRTDALQLNLTGFVAKTSEQNYQIVTGADGALTVARFDRGYRAYGAEFEGEYQIGPFNLAASATYTDAKITKDDGVPSVQGNTPRHQPKLMVSAMPSVTLGKFSAGSSVLYTGSSYAQDANQLKMPAYTVVNAFAQFRPARQMDVTVTASNLFNTLGLVDVTQGSLPASGIASARVINGRTLAATLTFRM